MILFKESLPRLDGAIRFLHALPDISTVDIYAYDKLLHSNLTFGNVTDYISLPLKKYKIYIYKSGTCDTPLASWEIDILPNNLFTVSIIYDNKKISILKTIDTEPLNNPLLSYIRFINLCPNERFLSLNFSNRNLPFSKTSYLENNDYYSLAPGIYNFDVSSTDKVLSKCISNVNFIPGQFITIYIIGLTSGNPRLGYILLRDGLKNQKQCNS